MNGLEYFLHTNAINEISNSIGFNITDPVEIKKVTDDLESSLYDYEEFSSLKNVEQEKVKEYLKKIENNPKIFEMDLSKKVNSISKKFTKGDLKKGLLEGIIEILTMKKPSKSKYTRKKKK